MPSYAPPFWLVTSVSFNYGKVRYLYNRSEQCIIMSQILETKFPSRIYQDLVFQRTKSAVVTLAKEAKCYVCSKGMNDGYSITAKNTTFGTLLFCDKHYAVD